MLTAQRRASRRTRAADAAMPLVFNDYMNTLMGDPTTEKLLPLVDAAADAGADLFCIDAGWYAEGHWWDTVGAWEPAASRFPGGLGEVVDHIRSRGMQAGLWLEPEVIGIHSPLASSLPDSAFVQHHGVRVAEHGRHVLDLRSPDARAHLDAVVDRLVGTFGVTFFKMDDNTMTGPWAGSVDGGRALLDWLDAVQARHPRLLIENCASGAMRADQAMLSRLHLQSTSDQQDPVLSASIAAAAPAAMLPEQAGNWAYPAPEMSDELFTLSLVNGVLGRMYLSGHLPRMSAEQRAVVADAVAAHRQVLEVVDTALPVWPLGLPGWEDPWVALGLRAASGDLYLSVWSLRGLRGRWRCRSTRVRQRVLSSSSRCSRRRRRRGRCRGTRPRGCCTSTTAVRPRRLGCSVSGPRGRTRDVEGTCAGWQTVRVGGREARCGQVLRLLFDAWCVVRGAWCVVRGAWCVWGLGALGAVDSVRRLRCRTTSASSFHVGVSAWCGGVLRSGTTTKWTTPVGPTRDALRARSRPPSSREARRSTQRRPVHGSAAPSEPRCSPRSGWSWAVSAGAPSGFGSAGQAARCSATS